jgi:hypothetical protein
MVSRALSPISLILKKNLLNYQWWKYSKFNNSSIPIVNITKSAQCAIIHLPLSNCYQEAMWFSRPQHHNTKKHKETRGVSYCGLAIYIKKVSRQKKNYGNSNISPCKNIIFKKPSKRNQNPSRYYNSVTSLKFQHKPKYHISKFVI